MTQNIGGITSKLGNRYEAKWLVLQLLDVIGERADWLRFEGITLDFKGYEFALHRKGRTEWHQTKLSAPNGNWTIGALMREGILDAFKARLATTAVDLCVFVSQDPAKDLRELASKARRANDQKEFDESLNDEERNKGIQQLEKAWGTDRQTTIAWLRRCEALSRDARNIESATETFSDFYFRQNGEAFAILRDYLEENFNKTITTDTIREDLRASGRLELKHWLFDPTLVERVGTETAAYLDTYSPFGAGGSNIPRKEVAALCELVTKPDGPAIVLLTGTAGSGKSGVTRGLIENLRRLGILHLAFRVDHHLDRRNPQELGEALTGRLESPAVTLKRLRPSERTILIVDQVDAISEVSGRSGAVRESLLRLIDGAQHFDTVRLVVICRSFDLDSDSRLRRLKDKKHIEEIKVPLLDWKEEVEPFLDAKEIKTGTFTQGQRDLLCLPLNLAVFLEVADDGGAFATRSDLFERLLEKKDRSIRNGRSLSWSAPTALAALARWMSDGQRLDAPVSVLDSFPGAVDVLASEHLIVRSRGMVNLFHESFFDYLYARNFSTRSTTLTELLMSTEQHLFRRTQTRQILETLRQTDPARYVGELRSVFASSNIRFHIKNAIALWLGSLPDPTIAERDIVNLYDDVGEPFSQIPRIVFLGSVGWFDLLAATGWVKGVLNGKSDPRRESVLSWLSNVSEERPTEVARILDAWWGNDAVRGKRLLDWFGYVRRDKPDGALVELCERVIRSKPRGIFENGGLQRREMLVATWVTKDEESISKILRALFDTWFETHPSAHLFDRDELREIDLHSLTETAKKFPAAFLEGALPALLSTVEVVRQRETQGTPDYSFSVRSHLAQLLDSDAFLNLYRSSLKALAKHKPDEARGYLARLAPCKGHQVILHLELETIVGSDGALADLLVELLLEPELLSAGWAGARWRSFADAARVSLPHLQPNEQSLVEQTIFSIHPEIERAAKIAHDPDRDDPARRRRDVMWNLNHSGFMQWCILTTIGADQLTPVGRASLEAWRRKFPGAKVETPDSFDVRGGPNSPIERQRAEHMSDERWLEALERHKTDVPWNERKNAHDGGPNELAGELQHATKAVPARFAALMASIPDDANSTYVEHILWGLAECSEPDVDSLKFAVSNAHARPTDHGRAIVRIFQMHPHIASHEATFEILAWYVHHGDGSEGDSTGASKADDQIITISDLLEKGGRIHVRNSHGARGDAAEALAKIAWNVPQTIPRCWQLIAERIDAETLAGVRCSLVPALLPLFNDDAARCAELTEALVDGREQEGQQQLEPRPLSAHYQEGYLSTAIPFATNTRSGTKAR